MVQTSWHRNYSGFGIAFWFFYGSYFLAGLISVFAWHVDIDDQSSEWASSTREVLHSLSSSFANNEVQFKSVQQCLASCLDEVVVVDKKNFFSLHEFSWVLYSECFSQKFIKIGRDNFFVDLKKWENRSYFLFKSFKLIEKQGTFRKTAQLSAEKANFEGLWKIEKMRKSQKWNQKSPEKSFEIHSPSKGEKWL